MALPSWLLKVPIIPWACVGYEIINSQRAQAAAKRLVRCSVSKIEQYFFEMIYRAIFRDIYCSNHCDISLSLVRDIVASQRISLPLSKILLLLSEISLPPSEISLLLSDTSWPLSEILLPFSEIMLPLYPGCQGGCQWFFPLCELSGEAATIHNVTSEKKTWSHSNNGKCHPYINFFRYWNGGLSVKIALYQ